jgi:hypothetical protein
MPFDGKVSDYFETKPAPVYDRDNPPPTMAEAIRMAVADVEAQERAGVQYFWGACNRCTAGAVVRRVSPDWNKDAPGLPREYAVWMHAPTQVPPDWRSILRALSELTAPTSIYIGDDHNALKYAFRYWPQGFAVEPTFSWSTPGYSIDPAAFKRDMLALADRLEAEAV